MESNQNKSKVRRFLPKQIVLTIAIVLALVYCINSACRGQSTNNEDKTMDIAIRITAGVLAALYLLFLYGVWKQNVCLLKVYGAVLIMQIISFFVYFVLGIHWLELLPNLIWSSICLGIVVYFIKDLRTNKQLQQGSEQA